MEILGEQSDTADVAGNTNSTDSASRGTEGPSKKTKIILTEKEQTFASLFQSAESNIDKPREMDLRHVSIVALTYVYTIVPPVIDYWKETIRRRQEKGDHPEISSQIEVMKTEVMKYQVLTDSITSFEERKDNKMKDTVDLLVI